MSNKKDIKAYQDAVWDYMLEHCEIMDGGALFIKFHTKSKSQFLGHVSARLGGYHREDPREKEKKAGHIFEQHVATKKVKREKWKVDKKTRFKLLKRVEIENRVRKYPPIIKQIIRLWLLLKI